MNNRAVILFLAMGYILGGGVEGPRKEQAALDWAIQTTKHCEGFYRADGFSNVTDCLEQARAEIDEERRLEALAEGYDPRR